jgi:hypothetical protein
VKRNARVIRQGTRASGDADSNQFTGCASHRTGAIATSRLLQRPAPPFFSAFRDV